MYPRITVVGVQPRYAGRGMPETLRAPTVLRTSVESQGHRRKKPQPLPASNRKDSYNAKSAQVQAPVTRV